MVTYKDKLDTELHYDDVVMEEGGIYWRVCIGMPNGDYLLSCTHGYCHDMKTKLRSCHFIGRFNTLKYLFECD